MADKITNQRELRAAFWEAHPEFTRRGNTTQNDYPADIRLSFCDYIDRLNSDGIISNALTQRATL